MSKRLRNLGQMWTNFRNSFGAPRQKVNFVGEDHLGNKYFEKEPDPTRNLRGSRYVDDTGKDQWSVPEIPNEWDAWLRNRRQQPPSQEELDYNIAVQLRTQNRVKEIKDRERQAKEEDLSSDTSLGSAVTADADKEKFPVIPEYEIYPGQHKEKYDRKS